MIRNHLRSAFRGLLKNPLTSFINIGGLGVGLCASLLIVLFVVHEYHFDNFHVNRDRIYLVTFKNGSPYLGDHMSFITGPSLMSSSPVVEDFTRISNYPGSVVLKDPGNPNRTFKPTHPLFADSNFFNTFSFRLLEGNASQVLKRPFTVVVTESLAKTLFGSQDPIGKRLTYNNKYTLEVTGVAADPPSNTDARFDMVGSLSSFTSMKEKEGEWQYSGVEPGNFKTYLLLKNAADAPKAERTLIGLAASSTDTVLKSFFAGYTYSLTPFAQEHLKINLAYSGHKVYLETFSLVAALIMGLALINYMSLATARATARAREVGVRKTLGARRGNVVLQFYIESTLCTCMAFTVGLILFLLVRPLFFGLLGITIDPTFLSALPVIGAFLALLTGTIFLAGSYPALVLSAFRPVDTLYGKMSTSSGGGLVRKVLTVMQFTVATGMIATLWLMREQTRHFRQMDPGFNRENVLLIPFDKDLASEYHAFKTAVSSLSGVLNVATTQYGYFGTYEQMQLSGGKFKGKDVRINVIQTDTPFIPTLQISWKYRPLDAAWASDPHAVLVNESAIKDLDLPRDPRGQPLPFSELDRSHIVGVVKDFAFRSLTMPTGSLCIMMTDTAANTWQLGGSLLLRIAPHTDLPRLLSVIKAIYKSYPSVEPFSYNFLDDVFDMQFREMDRMAALLQVGTMIAIGIAALGLFALAVYSTTQRAKEISIRKILGAGVPGIVRLMTGNFLWLVILAVMLAAPLAWWVMHAWLQQYANRISISPWILLCSGLGMIALAILTVGGQAFKAARANPVKNLRTE